MKKSMMTEPNIWISLYACLIINIVNIVQVYAEAVITLYCGATVY